MQLASSACVLKFVTRPPIEESVEWKDGHKRLGCRQGTVSGTDFRELPHMLEPAFKEEVDVIHDLSRYREHNCAIICAADHKLPLELL